MENTIGTRGREFVGTVINAKMQKTVTVEWPRTIYIPKYERYLTKRTRVKAHNPESINAKVGDQVRIMECRKLSKTKSFIIIEKLGVNFGYVAREGDLKAGVVARSEKPKEHPKTEAEE
jgi:small subunit ribosomal protein S17